MTNSDTFQPSTIEVRGQKSVWRGLASRLRQWSAKRQERKDLLILRQLEDHLLRDVGIARDEIESRLRNL